MIIKLTESIKGNSENIAAAQKFIAEFADKAETAFIGAGIDCEFDWGKPKTEPRKLRDDNSMVDDILLNVTIGHIIFRFKINVYNIFSGAFLSTPDINWGYSGHEMVTYNFEVEDALKLVSATKIAKSLSSQFKSEYAELLKTL